jgi:peptidyl-prolyl cis-trans isomerase SurA
VTTGKVRYSARAKTEKATKAAAKTVKTNDKVLATPVAATADEKATQQTQAAPLGLNGDTAKKKKKVKVKGVQKERIQQKPPEPAPPPPEPAPYRNPQQDGGTAPAPTAPAPAPPTN